MNYLYIPVIIFTLIILLYVTYQDIKYREINIMSLIVLAIFSSIYLGLFIFKKEFILWKLYFFQIAITFGFVVFFYLLGKLSKFTYIGEGDLYTILALSFTNIFNIFLPIFIFFVSLVLTLFVPIFIFVYNLFSRNFPKYSFFKSFYLMFLGYPLALDKITKFYTPLENFTFSGNKLSSKVVFTPNVDPEKEILLLKRVAKKNSLEKIWVSPLIPFIIFILLSYIILMLLNMFNLIDIILSVFI